MITVKVKSAEISAVFARLSVSLTDMTPVMQETGEYMVDSTKQRFIQGVAPDGTVWAPKSPATLDAYARRGDGVDFRPLFGPSRRLSSEISHRPGPDSVEISSNLIYAAVMQFGAAKGAFGTGANGSAIPWGNIPARPFLGISDEDRANIIDIVEEWLVRVSGGGN